MGHGNAAAAVLVLERACHFLNRLAMEKSHMGHVLKHQTIRYFLDTFVVFLGFFTFVHGRRFWRVHP